MRRIWSFGLLNAAASSFTIFYALASKNNFYSATVYISKSNFAILVLLCALFYLIFLSAYFVRFVLFGALRPIEIEHIWENAYVSISETFLAMTIFREEFNVAFGFAFIFLLIVKGFHWLLRDRIDLIEQTLQVDKKFLVRNVTVAIGLMAINLHGVFKAVSHFRKYGPSIMILFGTEYCLLLIFLTHNIVRFIFNLIDISDTTPWEEKSSFVFYLELATDFIKLSVYLLFFGLVTKFYGLPIHIIRDLYYTVKSFAGRVKDLIRYKKAISNLEKKYPYATAEELAQTDKVCIICRDELTQNVKKLPCGHFFHFNCLKTWIERQQSCPTCRRQIFEDSPAASPQATIVHQNNEAMPEAVAPANIPPQAANQPIPALPRLQIGEIDEAIGENSTGPTPNTQIFDVKMPQKGLLPIVLLPEGQLAVMKDAHETPEIEEEEFLMSIESRLNQLVKELNAYKLRRKFRPSASVVYKEND